MLSVPQNIRDYLKDAVVLEEGDPRGDSSVNYCNYSYLDSEVKTDQAT